MAGNRSIVVTLRANVSDFKSQFDAATKAAEETAKSTEDAAKRADTAMGQMVQSAKDNREAWTTAGASLTAFGAATLGGLGLATKAAMDWESAWAGVQKTVDGTAPQMAALESGLRGLARELPASHEEIAAVAEAAGQLGIATPNILGFTRTMIDMGESTNLSAEEAATALARFMNITQTGQGDVGRLGAAVVGLGNNFATTESEIVDMSMRLAGAGTQAGLTEGEILGMATAMSSVGIEAEAGGTAMSTTMKRIGKAVDEGGDSLDLFAQVSGMSAEEFSAAWRSDPASAIDAFVTGLSTVESQGMTTNGVLAELGITGIRESDALLRLSASTGTLADAMAQGNAEFESGTALIEEASKRYETAESRVAMARNAIVDAGISIGSVFLPVVAQVADGVADMAGAFADLPGPVHAVAGGLAGVAGAAGLGAGAFLMIAPRVLDTVSAFKDLGAISPGTASNVGRVTLAVGKLGGAVALLAAVPPVLNSVTDAMRGINDAEFDLGMNELTAGLTSAEESGSVFDSTMGDLYESGALNKQMFSDLGSTITEVSNINWFQNLIGPLAASGINDAKDRLTALSDAFVVLAQTDLSQAQSSFAAFMTEAEAGGATFEQVLEVMPSFRNELVGVAEAMGLDGTDSAVLYKIAVGELTPVVDEATGAVSGYSDAASGAAEETQSAADAASELYDSMSEVANAFIDSERAALDYKDALEEASAAAEENGKHWEDGTQAADDNKRALLDLADQALATAETLKADNESGTFLAQAREDLIDTAMQFGATREEAEQYVDQLGLTPEYIDTQVELDTEAAKEKWNTLWADLGYHPPEVPVDADTEPAKEKFDGLVSDVPPAEMEVDADTTNAGQQVYGFAEVVNGTNTEVQVDANTEPSTSELARLESVITASGGSVWINGKSTDAEDVLSTLLAEIDGSDGTVEINGETYTAEEALDRAIKTIDQSGGTITISGNNAPANSATDSAKAHADNSTGTIDVDANTGGAESEINTTARDRSSTITASAVTGAAESALNFAARSRSAIITQRVRQVFSGFSGSAPISKAVGGPVYGPGTGTSDSIPAYLSNGEHVLTAAEVALAGGHDAIYQMRSAIRTGALRFADGGGVEGGRVVPAASLDRGVSASSLAAAFRDAGRGSTTFAPTFHNYNSDAVRTTREQVAQFGQKVDAMAISL